MASNANDNGDDNLIFKFGQFMLHEMSQEMVDRILWGLKEQQLDRIPSLTPRAFLHFAAVHFISVRLKVCTL